MGVFAKTGARARRQMESASGVCVLATTGADTASDVAVGRSMQRAWLALTRRGLVAHPMSSLAALEAMMESDALSGAPGAEAPRIRAVVAAARAAFPNLERGSRIVLFMRFGWAQAPTTRVRRLALGESVAASPPAT
jgi:hypothetical protein